MAHTIRDKAKLIARISRIRGQLNGVERSLKEDKDCFSVLQTVAACRGALSGLMAEIVEGHIQFHLADPKVTAVNRSRAAGELIDVVRAFLR